MLLTGLGLSVPAHWQQPKSRKNSSSVAVIPRESARFPTQTQAAELAQRILSTQCTMSNKITWFFSSWFHSSLFLCHMYFLPSSFFVSWLPVFWGHGFGILACGTYTTVQMTSHWEVTHLCSRLNHTEIGQSVTATLSQGTAPEVPKVNSRVLNTDLGEGSIEKHQKIIFRGFL